MRDKLGETLKQRLWDEYQSGDPEAPKGRPPARERAAPAAGPEGAPVLAAGLTQWVAGLVSLTLVIGAIYWVFELGRRDANAVPVIQAMGGVARVLPVESGGPEVDNQGLQVNEVLGSNTTAPIEPETRLAPPPQRVVPADVTPDPPATPTATPAILTPLSPVQNPAPAPVAPAAPAFTLPPSLPDADPNMVRPLRRVPVSNTLPESADLLSNAIADAIREATDGPTAAPTATQAAPSAVPAPPPATAPGSAQSPPPVVGEIMIQLGAYDDEQSANQDYDALLGDNQDLMGGLLRFVERRESGGRVFYRLRARGFTSMDEATTMCKALLARAVQCIAVTAR